MTPEVVPPRVPQFNWVDLGLPSGTLWLDRPLGAGRVGDFGLMYQWGSLMGYMSTSQFDFSLTNYEEQGLNLISSDLPLEHDAAAMYYGNIARMPDKAQLEELIANTTISRSSRDLIFKSNINGNVIRIRARGQFIGQTENRPSQLYVWSRSLSAELKAYHLHVSVDQTAFVVDTVERYIGLLILPVKSS